MRGAKVAFLFFSLLPSGFLLGAELATSGGAASFIYSPMTLLYCPMMVVCGFLFDARFVAVLAGVGYSIAFAFAYDGLLGQYVSEDRPPNLVQGPLGSASRREFTVIGDAVNTASRAEGLCKRYCLPILVTGEVFAQAAVPPPCAKASRRSEARRSRAGRQRSRCTASPPAPSAHGVHAIDALLVPQRRR